MANNVIVSISTVPGTPDDHALAEALKKFGGWARVYPNIFIVKTDFGADYVANELSAHAKGAPLIVVNASANQVAHANLDAATEEMVRTTWVG